MRLGGMFGPHLRGRRDQPIYQVTQLNMATRMRLAADRSQLGADRFARALTSNVLGRMSAKQPTRCFLLEW